MYTEENVVCNLNVKCEYNGKQAKYGLDKIFDVTLIMKHKHMEYIL